MIDFKQLKSILILLAGGLLLLNGCSNNSSGTAGVDNSITLYEVKLKADPSQGGKVSPEKGKFVSGKKLAIKATPAKGYQFKNWGGDFTGTKEQDTITVDGNKEIVAHFEPMHVALNISASGNGSVIVDPDSSTYQVGTIVKLTAEPEGGQEFTKWEGDVPADSATNNPLLYQVAGSNNITAVFGNSGFNLTSAGNYPVGEMPASVVTGDLNGDGNLDMVTANQSTNNVSVLLSDGNGGVSSTNTIEVGTKPFSVALGDVNGDGTLDIVVANNRSKSVSVLLGDGSGGFSKAAGSPFDAGTQPISVALGDMNGDGNLDVVVANRPTDSVNILLGDGSGKFSLTSDSPIDIKGTKPFSVALGDVNDDGALDIVTANRGSGDVSVLLGDGNGGVSSISTFKAGPKAISVALGDMDGDGNLDIVVANWDSDNVSVLLGDGSGGFNEAADSPFDTGKHPHSVALGDMNGDKVLDMVVDNWTPGNLTVFIGNGNGGIDYSTTYEVGSQPGSVAIGDLNGDGDLDVVTTNRKDNNISILLNQ